MHFHIFCLLSIKVWFFIFNILTCRLIIFLFLYLIHSLSFAIYFSSASGHSNAFIYFFFEEIVRIYLCLFASYIKLFSLVHCRSSWCTELRVYCLIQMYLFYYIQFKILFYLHLFLIPNIHFYIYYQLIICIYIYNIINNKSYNKVAIIYNK